MKKSTIIILAGGASAILAAGLAVNANASTPGGANADGDQRNVQTLFEQPIFGVEAGGTDGDNHLMSIDFGGGTVFRDFIFASSVTGVVADENHAHHSRIVSPPNCTAEGVNVSMADATPEEFAEALRYMLNNTNLSQFHDNHSASPYFEYVVHLDRPLRDNHSGPDNIGEIIMFERGAGTANSFLNLQPLDADGNPIGDVYLVNPNNMVATRPAIEGGVYSTSNMSMTRSQPIGAFSIDLSDMGVTECHALRVSRATVGVAGLTSGMLSGGRDTNPDFKLIFVQTRNVAMPGYQIGD